MKAGELIEYVSTCQCSGVVVAVQDGHVEFSINSAGWLAKPNETVPLAQVLTAGVQVGQPAQYVVKTAVKAKVNIVYDGALDVTPLHYSCTKYPARFLISKSALVAQCAPATVYVESLPPKAA